MIRRRRGATWSISLAAVWAAVLLLASVTGASAVPTVGPSVTVDPPAAVAGAQLTATATGFGECVATGAVEGGTVPPPVVIRALSSPATWVVARVAPAASGTVAFSWDGEPLVEAPVSGEAAAADFTIPVDAAAGTHVLVASCLADSSLAARTEVTVEPPVATPTIVPPLVGLTLGQAEEQLKEAELFLGEVTELEGELIESQEPDAGTEAERGSSVDVVVGTAPVEQVAVPALEGLDRDEARAELEEVGLALGSVTGSGLVARQSHAPGAPVPVGTVVDVFLAPPGLVTVPRLVGSDLATATDSLVDVGLVLGQVSGDDPQPGDVVRAQRPLPGARVAPGSAVTLSVEPGVPPVVVVVVPDVVGSTVAEARTVLSLAGLSPLSSADADAVVAGQSPAGGLRVPRGTPVTMTVTEPAGGTFPAPILWGVVAAVALAAAASLMTRATRGRRGRRWARQHVRVEPLASRPLTVAADDAPGDPGTRTRVVRLEPRPVRGDHLVKELDR